MRSIDTLQDIGTAIASRRRKLGLDQATLARQAGVGRQWLSEVENGKERVDLGAVLRTLAALGYRMTLDAPPADEVAQVVVPWRPIRKIDLAQHLADYNARKPIP